MRRLAFDPYLLIVPQDWAITVHSPGDLEGRPWVAGPPGTACDHALRRVAAQAGVTTAASDVWVEFPSVIALVEAGRGAAIIPRLALTGAAVTIYPLPEPGGRHISPPCTGPAGLPRPRHGRNSQNPRRDRPAADTRTLTAASSHRPLRQTSPLLRTNRSG